MIDLKDYLSNPVTRHVYHPNARELAILEVMGSPRPATSADRRSSEILSDEVARNLLGTDEFFAHESGPKLAESLTRQILEFKSLSNISDAAKAVAKWKKFRPLVERRVAEIEQNDRAIFDDPAPVDDPSSVETPRVTEAEFVDEFTKWVWPNKSGEYGGEWTHDDEGWTWVDHEEQERIAEFEERTVYHPIFGASMLSQIPDCDRLRSVRLEGCGKQEGNHAITDAVCDSHQCEACGPRKAREAAIHYWRCILSAANPAALVDFCTLFGYDGRTPKSKWLKYPCQAFVGLFRDYAAERIVRSARNVQGAEYLRVRFDADRSPSVADDLPQDVVFSVLEEGIYTEKTTNRGGSSATGGIWNLIVLASPRGSRLSRGRVIGGMTEAELTFPTPLACLQALIGFAFLRLANQPRDGGTNCRPISSSHNWKRNRGPIAEEPEQNGDKPEKQFRRSGLSRVRSCKAATIAREVQIPVAETQFKGLKDTNPTAVMVGGRTWLNGLDSWFLSLLCSRFSDQEEITRLHTEWTSFLSELPTTDLAKAVIQETDLSSPSLEAANRIRTALFLDHVPGDDSEPTLPPLVVEVPHKSRPYLWYGDDGRTERARPGSSLPAEATHWCYEGEISWRKVQR